MCDLRTGATRIVTFTRHVSHLFQPILRSRSVLQMQTRQKKVREFKKKTNRQWAWNVH